MNNNTYARYQVIEIKRKENPQFPLWESFFNTANEE